MGVSLSFLNLTIGGANIATGKYRSNGENPGELICDQDRYGCVEDKEAKIDVCPGGQIQHSAAYCDFSSDGSTSAASYARGTCTFQGKQEFGYPKNPTPAQIFFTEIKDNNGKGIGGGEGPIKFIDGREIVMNTKLPSPLKIKMTSVPEDLVGGWLTRSANFEFTYGENSWKDTQDKPPNETGPQQSCSIAGRSVLGTGYIRTYDCKFTC